MKPHHQRPALSRRLPRPRQRQPQPLPLPSVYPPVLLAGLLPGDDPPPTARDHHTLKRDVVVLNRPHPPSQRLANLPNPAPPEIVISPQKHHPPRQPLQQLQVLARILYLHRPRDVPDHHHHVLLCHHPPPVRDDLAIVILPCRPEDPHGLIVLLAQMKIPDRENPQHLSSH